MRYLLAGNITGTNGAGRLAYSDDGTAFIPCTLNATPATAFHAVAASDTLCIAIELDSSNGDSYVWTSLDDGITFDYVADLLGIEVSSVVYENGFFYAVGVNSGTSAGVIYRSANGTAWSLVHTATANSEYTEIIFAENRLVAVGGNLTNSTGLVSYSTNGTVWTTITPGSQQFEQIVFSTVLGSYVAASVDFVDGAVTSLTVSDTGASWSPTALSQPEINEARCMGVEAGLVLFSRKQSGQTPIISATLNGISVAATSLNVVWTSANTINRVYQAGGVWFILGRRTGLQPFYSAPSPVLNLGVYDLTLTALTGLTGWTNTRDVVGFDTEPAVVISNVVISNITETDALITWDTDVPATTQVQYGTTDEYGTETVLDTDLVEEHEVQLSGLLPGTVYHFEPLSVA